MTEIDVVVGIAFDAEVDVLIVPVALDGLPAALGKMSTALATAIADLAEASDFTGKSNTTLTVPVLGALSARRLLLTGVGGSDASLDDVRRSFARACRDAVACCASSIGIAGDAFSQAPARLEAVVEGLLLAAYRFTEYFGSVRAEERDKADPVLTLIVTNELEADSRRAIVSAGATVRGVCLARDLVSTPANGLTPEHVERISSQVAEEFGLELTVLDVQDLQRLGAGAILGVGQGSDVPPRLIHLTYTPEHPSGSEPIALIGKCITFDTGGYSIKTADGMLQMKTDMGGGAAVLGAMTALRALGVDRVVQGIVCVAENMISGGAIRPGDVLTAMNGVTIEITSTDAEGRLVLADGMVYAARLGVGEMIDLATLTGAAVVALGDTTALFANDDGLAERLLDAGEATGEHSWRMPLIQRYKRRLKGEVADLKNTGGRAAGAVVAALFLEHFCEGVKWAHLDIAGAARSDRVNGYLTQGGTGVGVRTLLHLLRSQRDQSGGTS